MRFLMADDDYFPTWWTVYPIETPVLVGWSPDACADRMRGNVAGRDDRAGEDIRSKQTLPHYAPEIGESMVAGFVHDWQSDIFSRGAYSYVKVGGLGAHRRRSEHRWAGHCFLRARRRSRRGIMRPCTGRLRQGCERR